jgi:hypothetical protein
MLRGAPNWCNPVSALVRLLYPVAAPRSVPSIIGWWERRRLSYNLAVGATGVFTLGVFAVCSYLPPRSHIGLPAFAVLMYAIMANVCYTAGWAIESALHLLWHDEVRPVGPVLFRPGVAFAVGLTLLPSVVAVFAWLARVAWAMF